MGISGWARIVSVESCPEIGPGTGRVVTGTFSRLNNVVLKVDLKGESEHLHPTATHPLFSTSRNDSVRADQLQPEEKLRTASGNSQVVSICALPGAHRVYNIEVEAEHCYFAGRQGY
ncbi:hypothetical protein DB346_22875 [Verrucomicrobia bacterium LW23]|nr:hypothetical protein DB346_22875 [Verrucomicrobia bacterium LW23]